MHTSDVHMVTSVSCGHCGSDLEFDEGWVCQTCELYWSETDSFNENAKAEYLDDEKSPCNYVKPEWPLKNRASDVQQYRNVKFRVYYGPCDLPEGHGMTLWEHNYPTFTITCEE